MRDACQRLHRGLDRVVVFAGTVNPLGDGPVGALVSFRLQRVDVGTVTPVRRHAAGRDMRLHDVAGPLQLGHLGADSGA